MHQPQTQADTTAVCSDEESDRPAVSDRPSPVCAHGSRAIRLPNRINKIVSCLRRYHTISKRSTREQ